MMLVVLLFWFGLARTGTDVPPPLEISHLKGDFYVYTSYGLYNGNPVAAYGMYVVTRQGVVLFDTPWDSSSFQPLLDRIEVRHHQKVVMCLSTHWHEDRTAGLSYYGGIGIKTYTTRLTDSLCRVHHKSRAAYLLHKDTVFQVGPYRFATYYPGPGHTQDNIVVWFEKEKILYGGCLIKSVEAKDLGNLEDGDIKAYKATLEHLRSHCPHPRYVIPGHPAGFSPQAIDHTVQLVDQYLENKSAGK